MNTKPNRRILVTGGAGYIGSHACKALATSGFEPVTLDNLVTGHRWAVKWGPLIEGDLADPNTIRDVLETYRPLAVIHFAASAYIGESVTNPRKYFQNNVQSTLNLLSGMVDSGIDRIVFSSTCATYGNPKLMPIPESHPQHPVNPYGESKLFVERVLHWYARAYALKSMSLRYFNAAGADEAGDLGEEHDPETHLIPLAIEAALTIKPLRILGNDYPTRDGTCIRDYVHVTDLAEAHVSAVDLLSRATAGCATGINLGLGTGSSVLQVVECIRNVLGREVPVEFAPRRDGDPPELVAKSSAPAVLGWRPRKTTLLKMVESACQWATSRSACMTVQG